MRSVTDSRRVRSRRRVERGIAWDRIVEQGQFPGALSCDEVTVSHSPKRDVSNEKNEN